MRRKDDDNYLYVTERETDFARVGFRVIFNPSPAAILLQTGKELARFGLTQRRKKIGAAQYTQKVDLYIQKPKRERRSQYKIFLLFAFSDI